MSAIVFSACLAGCFGASALYHRPTWQPVARSWFARLDHAGIYLLIAGTYTPIGLIIMSRAWAIPVLSVVYCGRSRRDSSEVLLGRRRRRRSRRSSGFALGWVGVVGVLADRQDRRDRDRADPPRRPLLHRRRGGLRTTRPDPLPAVLGYHELFHICTIAAAACHWAAIAFFVLPRDAPLATEDQRRAAVASPRTRHRGPDESGHN